MRGVKVCLCWRGGFWGWEGEREGWMRAGGVLSDCAVGGLEDSGSS